MKHYRIELTDEEAQDKLITGSRIRFSGILREHLSARNPRNTFITSTQSATRRKEKDE